VAVRRVAARRHGGRTGALIRGIVACAFANFYALVADPREEVVRHVNAVKGRPLDQVGSITTTTDRIAACFDWSRLRSQRQAAHVRALIDAFLDVGPLGFRGPAADRVPDHLTQLDGGVRTTQVIAPGRDCPSNAFFGAARISCRRRAPVHHIREPLPARDRRRRGARALDTDGRP